jgi:hypothetical protein
VISGFFDRDRATITPRVRVFLFLPGIKADWVSVAFVLDTGAVATCLHPADAAETVGIDQGLLGRPLLWPHRLTRQGIGGTTNYYVVPALYGFRHDDGRQQTVAGKIEIAEPVLHNQTLPSLLGWDVLQHFRVVVDWPARQITLA